MFPVPMYCDSGPNISAMPVNRKRQRSADGDACDLMPISKRINDLHIRSGVDPNGSIFNNMQHAQPFPNMNICHVPQDTYCGQNQIYPIATSSNVLSIMPGASASASDYSPELSASENPYYYHVNGMLYEAHLQRMQRSSKSGL